jgi:uncharacterized peroxidase-related enzyme
VAGRHTFLGEPPDSDETRALYDADRSSDGYVSNLTRLWGWRPDLLESFVALRTALMKSSTLTDRDWAVLVTSAASQLNDSYCSLAWGDRLAELSDGETAAQVLSGVRAPALSEREAALAAWARRVVQDPNAATERDAERLREAGLDEREIFEATAFVAFRLAFSTVNDALGAAPDKQLADAAPAPVRAAVTYGRAPSPEPSRP